MCLGKWEPIPATVIINRGLEQVIIAPGRKCNHLLPFCWLCTFLMKIAYSPTREGARPVVLLGLQKRILGGSDLGPAGEKLPMLLTYPQSHELLGLLITQLGPNYQHPLHQKASHGQGKVAAIRFDR